MDCDAFFDKTTKIGPEFKLAYIVMCGSRPVRGFLRKRRAITHMNEMISHVKEIKSENSLVNIDNLALTIVPIEIS